MGSGTVLLCMRSPLSIDSDESTSNFGILLFSFAKAPSSSFPPSMIFLFSSGYVPVPHVDADATHRIRSRFSHRLFLTSFLSFLLCFLRPSQILVFSDYFSSLS